MQAWRVTIRRRTKESLSRYLDLLEYSQEFFIENRGYYVKFTDPELVRELVEELDDADKFNSYLDEWR